MSNETISVPRELLDRLHSCARGLEVSEWAELRALLAQPAEQHQGEPVGVIRASSTPGIAPFADIWPWLEPGTKLYTHPAEQPGPVAVGMPERMPTGNNVEGVHNRLSPGVREGWNRCLDEVVRLNALCAKGWQLVPMEPTDDMVIAFAEAWYSKRQAIDDPDMLDAYRDMLVVAPSPPQQ